MTRFEYINNNLLTPKGIKDQIKAGIIPTSVLRHFEIYSRYDYYRKAGNNVSTSVFNVSEDFGINERSVYKVITNMQEEI